MNAKGFAGSRNYDLVTFTEPNKDFEEFLEILNVFPDSSRKPYKTAVLNSRSIAEFINKTSYSKFNSEFFENSSKNLTDHDFNNLILIRSLVEHNYQLLLRIFNEAPLFMSRKIGLHPQSQRYFTMKLLLLCANLANPYQQMDEDILKFLEIQLKTDKDEGNEENEEDEEIEKNDDNNDKNQENKGNHDKNQENEGNNDENDIIMNTMGIKKDFFSCLCAAEDGKFVKFLGYLASKDHKFMPLASLFCWFHVPFIAYKYTSSKSNKQGNPEEKSGISVLLMYGIMNILNIFFENNKKDLFADNFGKSIANFLDKNIMKIMDNFLDILLDRPIQNVSWFTIEITDIWDGINQDFSEFLLKELKIPEAETATFFKNIHDNYGLDFLKVFNSVSSYISKNYLRDFDEKEAELTSPFFKFFPLLFFGTSGLQQFDLLDNLIEETFDTKNDVIDTFLKGFHKYGEKSNSDANIDNNRDKKVEKNGNSDKNVDKKLEMISAEKGALQLIMVGFEMIEKNKKDRISNAENRIDDILKQMLNKNQDPFVDIMLQIILYLFSDTGVFDKEVIGKIFIVVLSQILLKVTEVKDADFIVKKEELEEELKKNEGKRGENGQFSEEFQKEITEALLIKKKGKAADIEEVQDRLTNINKNPELLIDLIEDVMEFISQFSTNSLEIKKQQLQEIASTLGKILFPSDENTQQIIESIFNFINGDFERLSPELFELFNIDRKTFKIIKGLLEEFKTILQAPQVYVNKKITYLTSSLTGQNVSSLDIIKDKLKMEKDMDSKDLFKVFDSDKSGKISLDEFKLLTKRLNMTLSDHRIREIFTSVKGEEINYSQELNEKEFEQAFNYLQEKSIMLTLEYLGITKEILFGILIWLTTLLLILFAFIFVGIAGFAVGGTFGSIINSMFPIGNFFSFSF